MQEIEITRKKFNSYKKIVYGVVHHDDTNIYKYSPASWPIMTTIEKYSSEECLKNIAVPKAYLMCQKKFFGFVMEYNKTLTKIKEAIQTKKIKNIEIYAMKLLEIIENLNQIGIHYWDFHSNNVLVNNEGEPFLVDIDGAEYIQDLQDLHNQREYLTEFLINIYLDKEDLFFIHKPKWDWIGRKYMSESTRKYIDTLGNLSKPIPELPYCIVEELKDEEKISLIKTQLKN